DINVFGPLARAADDLGLALDVLAGPPPELATAWTVRLPAARRASVAEHRVAVWFDEPSVPLDAEYRSLLIAAVDALADAGARVVEAHPPVDFGAQYELFFNMMVSAASPMLP